MKLEAIRSFNKKLIILDVNSESWNLNCAKFIDEINNENNMTINKYIKLTNLIPELLELVDNKRIAFRPAIELYYLSKEKPNQKERFSIPYEELRKYLKKDYFNKEIENIICGMLRKY